MELFLTFVFIFYSLTAISVADLVIHTYDRMETERELLVIVLISTLWILVLPIGLITFMFNENFNKSVMDKITR